jgi:recombinational DNA repair ATPase RecF
LGELEVLRAALREEPILLLDDVFSELDPHRRVWLGRALGAGGQTLLSSAEPGAAEAAAPAATFEVEAGEVSKRG